MSKYLNKLDKILIAGAHGMVGKAINKALITRGSKNILTPSRKQLDLTQTDAVNNYFQKNCPDVVILSAAKVGGIEANRTQPADFIIDNLLIQNNIILSSFENKVKRFLFIGSSCIYPKFAKQPIEEEELMNGKLEETNEAYAIAKIAAIKTCAALKKQYDFDSICLMPTNLYGPGDRFNPKQSHVIPSLVLKFHDAKIKKLASVRCWGTGSPYREFLHVDDLGKACVISLESLDLRTEKGLKDKFGKNLDFVNVGTGKDIQIRDLVELIRQVVGYKGNIVWDTSMPDGTPRKLLNIDRIKSIGWEPSIELEEGLKEYYKYYLKCLEENNLRT